MAVEPSFYAAMVNHFVNKVRAGIARLPEDSEFTSAFDRIQGLVARQRVQTRRSPAVLTAGSRRFSWRVHRSQDSRSRGFQPTGGDARHNRVRRVATPRR